MLASAMLRSGAPSRLNRKTLHPVKVSQEGTGKSSWTDEDARRLNNCSAECSVRIKKLSVGKEEEPTKRKTTSTESFKTNQPSCHDLPVVHPCRVVLTRLKKMNEKEPGKVSKNSIDGDGEDKSAEEKDTQPKAESQTVCLPCHVVLEKLSESKIHEREENAIGTVTAEAEEDCQSSPVESDEDVVESSQLHTSLTKTGHEKTMITSFYEYPTMMFPETENPSDDDEPKQSGEEAESLHARQKLSEEAEKRVLVSSSKAPSRRNIIHSSKEFGIPSCRYTDVYCSNARDVPEKGAHCTT